MSVVSGWCMSRHFGNEGKPRPPVAWSVTYGCVNEHVITTEVCDGCATSLLDRHQHCARCIRPMVVTDLVAVTQ